MEQFPSQKPRRGLSRFTVFVRAGEIVGSFSSSGRALFYILGALILASSVGILLLLNNSFLIIVPLRGGVLTEGIIGSPRFVNPVLAIDQPDRDLTALVYSGLFKKGGTGDLIPDLASSYDLMPDGRTYTVHIRPTATFQDGTPVTANDISFTIQKVLDPALKSPLRAMWQGVTVTVIDPQTITFTLPQPYAPFLGTLTVGILPAHLWQNVSDDEFSFSNLNTMPIGSGPYRVIGVSRSASGAAVSYDLTAFAHYAGGEPYISEMITRFYSNEDQLTAAIQSGEIDSAAGVSPASLTKLDSESVRTAPLNRVFGVFFNQNNNAVLQDAAVREALSIAIDRKGLINDILAGYGVPLTGPLPPTLASANASSTPDGDLTGAKALLAKDGWQPRSGSMGDGGMLQKSTATTKTVATTVGTGKKKHTVTQTVTTPGKIETLAFTLSTSDVPELKAAALELAKTWSSLGAMVSVQVYAASDLSENVIRPRKYDALFFGEIVGQPSDLYAFWDSKERNDPGLNIALYANSTVDGILEKLRSGTSGTPALLSQLSSDISQDTPAVFLYSPDFLYVVPSNLQGLMLGAIDDPSDRFATINQWYLAEDNVWRIFAHH